MAAESIKPKFIMGIKSSAYGGIRVFVGSGRSQTWISRLEVAHRRPWRDIDKPPLRPLNIHTWLPCGGSALSHRYFLYVLGAGAEVSSFEYRYGALA